jgi:urease accessory protein
MIGSLQSSIDIAFRFDETQFRTVLSRRQAGGLCHLSKPYWNGQVLCLQLVNPTAGLFSGDNLRLNVTAGDQSQVALTSPSASRYHTMPTGRAHLTQRFVLGEDAWLDYWPEMVIPQRDSDVLQTSEIHLARGASMVFLDLLAPGRVAYGERYRFRRLETKLEIQQEGQLLAKERCVLEPDRSIWPLQVPGWDLCYYGAIWIAGPQTEQAILALTQRYSNPAAYQIGATLVADQLGVVRVVANTSLWLRKVTQGLREDLQATLPLLTTDFRKL